MLSISHVLVRARALYSNHLAIWDGDTKLSYQELGQRVDALVGALKAMGLRKGDRIAVMDVNSHRYLECYYAAAQTGIIMIPMNSRLAPLEVAYVLNDAGAKALFVSGRFWPIVRDAQPKLNSVESLVVYEMDTIPADARNYETLIAEATPDSTIEPSELDDLCNIYYTSGTTGEPKGVCLTYRNMTASMLDSAIGLGLSYRDVWMHAAPMFHLVDAWAVWSIPLLGGTQVPMHFDPIRFLTLIQLTRTTAVALPPTLINMVCQSPRIQDFDLSSLRLIMFGGSPAPTEVLQRAAQTIPVNYVHAYGVTETSGIATLQRPEDTLKKAGSAGHPVAHVELTLANDDQSPVPTGSIGEVLVRGERVMKGYWNKQKATAEALRDGWYHTGDMGYFDEAQDLYIVDRKKDMIITGGENVYSVEVENILSSYPAIMEVVVIGVPDALWGEAVKAIVVLRPGFTCSELDLINYCRENIAAYKAPKSIDFYPEPLPRTNTGKLAKRSLRERFWKDKASAI